MQMERSILHSRRVCADIAARRNCDKYLQAFLLFLFLFFRGTSLKLWTGGRERDYELWNVLFTSRRPVFPHRWLASVYRLSFRRSVKFSRGTFGVARYTPI